MDEIRKTALQANAGLLELIRSTREHSAVPFEEILRNLTSHFRNAEIESRIAAVHWVLILHKKDITALEPFFPQLFPALLAMVSDPSDAVVSRALEVMARISQVEEYFQKLLSSLVDMFAADLTLHSRRGAMIIRQLCLFIAPRKILLTLSNLVEQHENVAFCSLMIQTLNVILLTSSELAPLRRQLRDFYRRPSDSLEQDRQTAELFQALYRAFCHNSVATLSLCFLAQTHKQSADLVLQISQFEITVNLLTEIDKLIQLLESPIFAHLRLQLLDSSQHPYLVRALYSLLMILPQSGAFTTLRNRLECVSGAASLHMGKEQNSGKFNREKRDKELKLDWPALYDLFRDTQRKHTELRVRKSRQEEAKRQLGEPKQRRKLITKLSKSTSVI